MRLKRYIAAFLLAFLSAFSYQGAPVVYAQAADSNAPGGGLRITPAITQIKLQPHEDTLILQYTVSNLTHQPLNVSLSARDFGALSQNGSITLYGAGYDPNTNSHGIQLFASFPNPNVIIPANTSQQVDVTIVNATKLAPGGHYGAILFSPQSTLAATGNNRVNLDTSVAGLVFLTTAYGGTYGLSASMSHISPLRFSLPDSAYLVFKNSGNTQTIPQGQLTLDGLHGNVLGTQVVNSSSGLVLSGGSRIFQVQLPLTTHWYTPPGVYHMKLQYKDSSDTAFKTLNQSFVYINWKVAALGIGTLILVIFAIRRFGSPLIKGLLSFMRYHKRSPKPPKPLSQPSAASPKVMDIVSPKRRKK